MKISLRRCHAPTVRNGAFSHRLDCNFVRDSKSRRTSKLHYWFKSNGNFAEKKWIFPIGPSGEASRWRVCYQWGLPRLVSMNSAIRTCSLVMFSYKFFQSVLSVSPYSSQCTNGSKELLKPLVPFLSTKTVHKSLAFVCILKINI